MRGVILLGEILAAGGTFAYVLYLVAKVKGGRERNKLSAYFIDGPWDGQERKVRKFTPTIVWQDGDDIIVYKHTENNGIYEHVQG